MVGDGVAGMNGTMRKGRPQSQPMDIETLRALERKILWLSTYLIHNANHIRANRDGLKVGGHQASSASLSIPLTSMSALTPSRSSTAARGTLISSRLGPALLPPPNQPPPCG